MTFKLWNNDQPRQITTVQAENDELRAKIMQLAAEISAHVDHRIARDIAVNLAKQRLVELDAARLKNVRLIQLAELWEMSSNALLAKLKQSENISKRRLNRLKRALTKE